MSKYDKTPTSSIPKPVTEQLTPPGGGFPAWGTIKSTDGRPASAAVAKLRGGGWPQESACGFASVQAYYHACVAGGILPDRSTIRVRAWSSRQLVESDATGYGREVARVRVSYVVEAESGVSVDHDVAWMAQRTGRGWWSLHRPHRATWDRRPESLARDWICPSPVAALLLLLMAETMPWWVELDHARPYPGKLVSPARPGRENTLVHMSRTIDERQR